MFEVVGELPYEGLRVYFDAQEPEILNEDIVMRQRNWIVDEEFDNERLILGAHALSVPNEVTQWDLERGLLEGTIGIIGS
jgi:hypothetical protein